MVLKTELKEMKIESKRQTALMKRDEQSNMKT